MPTQNIALNSRKQQFLGVTTGSWILIAFLAVNLTLSLLNSATNFLHLFEFSDGRPIAIVKTYSDLGSSIAKIPYLTLMNLFLFGILYTLSKIKPKLFSNYKNKWKIVFLGLMLLTSINLIIWVYVRQGLLGHIFYIN